MKTAKKILNRGSDDSREAANSDSRSLAKGLRILETLSALPDPVGLSSIAAMIGLGKASTLRLLRTLVNAGYLERDRHDNYSVSRDWSAPARRSGPHHLVAAADPLLRQLHAEMGETVSLAFLFGDLIRVAAVVESTHPIRMSNYPGRVLQPYASSLGKSIAAFQAAEVTQRLLHTYGVFPLTQNTLVDFRAIQDDFSSVRRRGYAWDREETVIGGTCAGAPIRDASGEVSAAVSISMPTARFTAEMEKLMPRVVADYAARIGASASGR